MRWVSGTLVLGSLKAFGVSRVTVIKWIKGGRIAAFSVHGRWRIPYGEVERVLRGVRGVRRVAI
jgi:putative resolvase